MSRLAPPTNRLARLSAPVARRMYGRDMPEAAAMATIRACYVR